MKRSSFCTTVTKKSDALFQFIYKVYITLVNTQIFAQDISTVSEYTGSADAENGHTFAELVLVFKITAFFAKNITYI